MFVHARCFYADLTLSDLTLALCHEEDRFACFEFSNIYG